MIESIDIRNFGCFKDFTWNNSIQDSAGKVGKFKKLNILYGRNYSGKTTLSRVFRSLQTGRLPDKYDSPSFSVSSSPGIITQTQIPTTNHAIRVYNTDFIDDHLSFLRDSEGKITPFAVIGSENKLIEQEIMENELQLGNVDEKTGLRYELDTKQAEFQTVRRAKKEVENELRQKLVNKANSPDGGIKHNPLYKDPNYDIRKIKDDIQAVRESSIGVLPEEEKKRKQTLLTETPLPDIDTRLEFNPTISTLHETAKNLLSKRITPSEPIQELLDDALLQRWVKEGIPHHKGKRGICGFCGQALPDDLWTKLDAHFSKESTDLEAALQAHIQQLKKEKEAVDDVITVERSRFYSRFHTVFDAAKKILEDELTTYQVSLDRIITTLRD